MTQPVRELTGVTGVGVGPLPPPQLLPVHLTTTVSPLVVVAPVGVTAAGMVGLVGVDGVPPPPQLTHP